MGSQIECTTECVQCYHGRTNPGLSGHVLTMESSEGLNCSCESCGWRLEGENSPPKLIVCIEVDIQVDGTLLWRKYPVLIPTLGEGQESLPSHITNIIVSVKCCSSLRGTAAETLQVQSGQWAMRPWKDTKATRSQAGSHMAGERPWRGSQSHEEPQRGQGRDRERGSPRCKLRSQEGFSKVNPESRKARADGRLHSGSVLAG